MTIYNDYVSWNVKRGLEVKGDQEGEALLHSLA